MAGPFYFAWVDPDTAFDPEVHNREDESIFGFELTQDEGDFAKLRLDIRNPRIGLLAPGRKIWAWFAYDGGDGPSPLFFGRLIGIPTSIFEDVATLEFVARPADYADQKNALAESLRVLPWFDPIFVDPDRRDAPELVLEARSALWHIDRITHELTISDILNGEDGTIDFSEDEIAAESLSLNLNNIPLRSVSVDAVIPWNQTGRGGIDMTSYIIRHWPNEVPMACISTFTFDGFVSGWPKNGATVGDGWKALAGSDCKQLRDLTMYSLSFQGNIEIRWWDGETTQTNSSESLNYLKDYRNFMELMLRGNSFGSISDPGGDYVLPAIMTDQNNDQEHDEDGETTSATYSMSLEVSVVPIGKLSPTLIVGYDSTRGMGERVQFTLEANVQPVLTLPGDDETLALKLNAAPVSDKLADGSIPIGDTGRRSYLALPRGVSSLEHLIALARAQLMARSRVVEIEFITTAFAKACDVTLRKSAHVHDPRLPGRAATGKIISYSMRLRGDDGKIECKVKIGCAIGYGGTVEAVAGAPNYVNAGYVDSDYQELTGGTSPLSTGDVGYSPPLFAPGDDGLDFAAGLTLSDVLVEPLVVTNPPAYQRGVLDGSIPVTIPPDDMPQVTDTSGSHVYTLGGWVSNNKPSPETADAMIEARLKQVPTEMTFKLIPLSGKFETPYAIDVTMLELPKQIDLEAAS